jgi:hypothetical protein
VVDRGTLYVAGQFDAVVGRARPSVAAFDVATGTLSAWNPSAIDRSINSVHKLGVAGDTVYVSVSFGSVGEHCGDSEGRGSDFLVAVDAAASAGVRWCSRIGPVLALAGVGDRLYIGGGSELTVLRDDQILEVVGAGTGVLGGWAPRPNGQVLSLVATPDGVLAGGDFSGLAASPRVGAAAIDLATHGVLAFDPDPSLGHGFEGTVDSVAPSGSDVFVAGDFAQIGGRNRRSLAKLDATTGQARRWNARVGSRGRPQALAVHGSRLYVGGDFRNIGGRPRRGLAALDTRTGRATPWRIDANGRVRALAINGHTLYVAGDFTRVGGHRRRHAAAIDLRNGRLTAWRPDPDGRVRALAYARHGIYLAGDFRHAGGKRRSHLAAVNGSQGNARPWRADANGRVHALAVHDGTVYVGGDFTSVDGASRARIAAIDGRTGTLSAWNPATNGRVSALLATPAGIVAAGSFTSLGGTSQTGVGIFPAA